MKLHSSKTLIQAQKRLSASLAIEHSREALEALSKELKFKLNTKVEKPRRGDYTVDCVSYTRLSEKDLGIFRLSYSSPMLSVGLKEITIPPDTIRLHATISYEHPRVGRIGASVGTYAYDVATKELTYLPHDY